MGLIKRLMLSHFRFCGKKGYTMQQVTIAIIIVSVLLAIFIMAYMILKDRLLGYIQYAKDLG